MIKQVVSDLGQEFVSEIFAEVCKFLRIEKIHSSAYHHQTIRALENSHKSLNAYIRNYAGELDWCHWLPYFTFTYNTSIHCAALTP
jgi:transposase InsO family protein